MNPYPDRVPEAVRILLGAGHLRRCHTIPSDVTQTVGHHSWGVAVILQHIFPECSKAALLWALYHDVAETRTGDVPATAKWNNPGLASELSAEEDRINALLGIDQDLDEAEAMAVKLADILDLLAFAQHRVFMGDMYFKEVASNIYAWSRAHQSWFDRYPRALEFLT